MKRLLGIDKYTGTRQYYVDDGDKFILQYEQDISVQMEKIKQKRNDESYSQKGIKEDWWHYCALPQTVIIELKQKGINVFDQNCTKALFKEINTNYPHLKLTRKRHA